MPPVEPCRLRSRESVSTPLGQASSTAAGVAMRSAQQHGPGNDGIKRVASVASGAASSKEGAAPRSGGKLPWTRSVTPDGTGCCAHGRVPSPDHRASAMASDKTNAPCVQPVPQGLPEGKPSIVSGPSAGLSGLRAPHDCDCRRKAAGTTFAAGTLSIANRLAIEGNHESAICRHAARRRMEDRASRPAPFRLLSQPAAGLVRRHRDCGTG